MLCEDEDEDECTFDLFAEDSNQLLTDDNILLLMLEDCNTHSEPTHRQYPRFDIKTLSDAEFITQFRFMREHIPALMRALRLKKCIKERMASDGQGRKVCVYF